MEYFHANIHFNETGKPLVIMDEPERSLDGLQEMKLWKAILDSKTTQVIVATHSIFPILHPTLFNLIETENGYIKRLQKALNTALQHL